MSAPIEETDRHPKNVALFEGCWRHIDAAHARRDNMIEVWNSYLDDEPYDSIFHVDEEGVAKLFIETVIPPPPGLPILFGEFLYHLRATLDNAVYDTAIHDSGRNPPPSASSLEFPITQSERAFAGNAYKVKPLSDQHRAVIEAVQPYRNEHGRKSSSFYWLNDLARKDRHRTLHFIGAYIVESNPKIRVPPGVTAWRQVVAVESRIPLLEDHAEVARWKITPWSETIRSEVDANPDLAIDPEIAEIARNRPLEVEWLWHPLHLRLRYIEWGVEGVMAHLERLCTGWTRSKLLNPLE